MKLLVYIEYYHPTPSTDFVTLWYQSMIWAVSEHGLSLFAASVLAIRPFFTYVSTSWTSLSSSLYGDASVKNSSGHGTSSRVSRGSAWPASPGMTELGTIGVRNEFEVRTEYDLDNSSKKPGYTVDAYNESSRMLVHGNKGTQDAGDIA